MHGIPTSHARIHYGYVVAGFHYQNETISFSPIYGTITWGFADRMVQKYQKGQMVNVSYDSDDPEVSCLEPGTVSYEDGIFILLFFAGMALGTNQLAKWARRIFCGPF
jgi:hypothetical protein